ncbi:hypothetical protein [Salibacterium aidingense]|uniref:hypothetical protein n=1 Tax=Salibacterium aidingense TaxID=384933 RepID=UPI000419B040|nr:hypothetical protein [Salibacterium aidingense]
MTTKTNAKITYVCMAAGGVIGGTALLVNQKAKKNSSTGEETSSVGSEKQKPKYKMKYRTKVEPLKKTQEIMKNVKNSAGERLERKGQKMQKEAGQEAPVNVKRATIQREHSENNDKQPRAQ